MNLECLQLSGLSERTQEAYVSAVRQLSEHYHKSPELITEEELRQYFLFIKNVKHYSRNTSTVAICGIKFFFEKTLNRDWATFGLLRAPREKKLPVILSREEVRQIVSPGEGAFDLPDAPVKTLRLFALLRKEVFSDDRVSGIEVTPRN